MKRVETNKYKAPPMRVRRTRFSDAYHWTNDVERSTTTSSRERRGVNEIQTVDLGRQTSRLTQRASSRSLDRNIDSVHSSTSGHQASPPRNSAGGGDGGTRRSPRKYTATKVGGLRYKFHSEKNGKPEKKSGDEDEDEAESQMKSETTASKDMKLSLSPQRKRKRNLEVPEEQLEEERGQAVVTSRETVIPEAAGRNSSKDCDDLANPPVIQTGKVVEPSHDDDDSEEDLDILIIDLSDKERAEMKSWAM